jgi:hypothetical protein
LTRVVADLGRPLMESGARSEFRPGEYHRHCFDDPALPLALASAVRFSCPGLPPMTVKLSAASSLRALPSFRVLPSNTYPTASAIRSSHGLWLPTAHTGDSRSACREFSQLATFRLQGLVTLLTVYSLESRAGSVSHRRRSWDSPFGGFTSRERSQPFRLQRTHLLLGMPLIRSRNARRSDTPQFLGPCLPRVPCDRAGF